MALSFGVAILPVKIEDYENDLNNNKSTYTRKRRQPGARRGKGMEHMQDESRTKIDQLVVKIEARMRQEDSQKLPRGLLIFGLCGMGVLFAGAQTAVTIVEQGGILPSWCVCRWWMHLWYLLGAIVFLGSVLEALAHAYSDRFCNCRELDPTSFEETWKLFVSDIPHNVVIYMGGSIIAKLKKSYQSVTSILQQLGTLRAGSVLFRGSQQSTRPRNAILIMVSVVKDDDAVVGRLSRPASKCASIAISVTGTAFFASTQLLAGSVVVMTLILVLAACVFSRALTGWIVRDVSKTEPMLHVILNSTQEAQHVIARILSLDEEYTGTQDELRKVQVEIGGHVFVEQRRVAYRTPWYLRFFGVLAEPFDLRKVAVCEYASTEGLSRSNASTVDEVELGLLRK
ncbi:MAG: hypothetical protein Q9183_005675 [Haloplaca sp. 2 TL-2023]